MRTYANSTTPATVLNSSCTSGASTISVVSEAELPGSGQYIVAIDTEFLLVTGGWGTGTLNVSRAQEGTSAAAHSNGASVLHPLTAGTITAIRTEMSGIGTYSSLPTSPTLGDRYRTTDSVYDFVYDGSTWQAFAFGYNVVVPPSTGWSWSNQGSSTVDATHGYLQFFSPTIGSDNCWTYMRTLPSTPYTAIIGVVIDTAYQGGATCAPLVLTIGDGTKFLQYGLFMFEQQGGGGNPYHRILEWNNTTSAASAYNTYADVAYFGDMGRIMFLKMLDDGTNLTWSYSLNKQYWVQFDQRARTAFLSTPTVVGVSAYNYTGSTAMLVSCEGI
jgi:hypothetical protein